MGLRSALTLSRAARDNVPGIRSPWTVGDLSSIVWADLLDSDLFPLTRAEAMTVPAMSRARHLLVGAIAGCPIAAYRGPDRLPDVEQPTWTYRSDTLVSPWERMLWTVDDILMAGMSLWAVARGADGFILAADRVDPELWQLTPDRSQVIVDGYPVDPGTVVLIRGPHEGVLTFAARTLRAASKLERSAARHATNPVPSIELHQEVDVETSETERDKMLNDWRSARASENGAVGYTSFGVRANVLGAVPEQLLIAGRNAAAVDVARHASIPAAMVDATTATASLTYETTQGRNQQFLDYGVQLYLDAIAARLSQDDVVPRGQRIGFDTTALTTLGTPPPGGTPTLD